MGDLQNGSLVQHRSLGLGKIVALEPNAVHVFFPGRDPRVATKLRLPDARAMLQTEGLAADAWLEGISGFSLDASLGRYALAGEWLTHERAVAEFMEAVPKGFADPTGGEGRSARSTAWLAGHAAFEATFGNGELERLVGDAEIPRLVKGAKAIDASIADLHLADDEGAVAQALSDPAAAHAFFVALADLLSVPSPGRARFEGLFATAAQLPVDPEQQWMVATLFPFLASPERQVLLRPRLTKAATTRLGRDFGKEPTPAWPAYGALKLLSTQLLEALQPAGAKDLLDVESFLHVIAGEKRPRRSKAAAAARARPAGAAVARTTTRARRTT